jgi:alanine-glyoxylate transaminase/serine-glyoxylate transaminase/serine-pyruvate transaminase
MTVRRGRHFLQIPGPTNVPDRILRAIDRPTIDHRGPEFAAMTKDILVRLAKLFRTGGAVAIFPGSGTGAWEAALVNTLSPGDRVLMFDNGQFASLWRRLAERLGLTIELISGDWHRGPDPAELESRLTADRGHAIRAVCAVHNETSTGVAARIPEIRQAIDRAKHPALFMVDVVSSLATMEFRQDDWKIDVAVAGSQKGLMLPPGLAINGIGPKALEVSRSAKLPRAFWRWDDVLENNRTGSYPYTPATGLLFGLREALAMLDEEGLPTTFARHDRLGEATRRAVRAWGLEVFCRDEREYSSSVTAVETPAGHNADAFRATALERFDMSLGAGLGPLAGKVFRIGHMGDFNELMLAGTLSGVEMGLAAAGVPHRRGGVQAALDYLGGAN